MQTIQVLDNKTGLIHFNLNCSGLTIEQLKRIADKIDEHIDVDNYFVRITPNLILVNHTGDLFDKDLATIESAMTASTKGAWSCELHKRHNKYHLKVAGFQKTYSAPEELLKNLSETLGNCFKMPESPQLVGGCSNGN